ncbi:MAG TPA: hypothetical protein VGE21_04955 [Flavobacteriales bacterium]
MKLLDRIKEWMGRRALLKENAVERRPLARNLADCGKIGIVYLAEDEKAFTQVRNYVKKIKEELGHHRIMVIGYHESKERPDYLHPKLHFDAITQKELNWYRIPQGTMVQNFLVEEHDVLIDLSLEDRLPIQYLVAKSRARFKVGRLSESNAHFLDMMIDTAGANSLLQFIANMDKYLMMINAKAQAPSLTSHGQ